MSYKQKKLSQYEIDRLIKDSKLIKKQNEILRKSNKRLKADINRVAGGNIDYITETLFYRLHLNNPRIGGMMFDFNEMYAAFALDKPNPIQRHCRKLCTNCTAIEETKRQTERMKEDDAKKVTIEQVEERIEQHAE